MSHIFIIILIIHTFVVRNSRAANDYNIFELGIPVLMRERNILDNRLQAVIQHRQEREEQRNDHGHYRLSRIMSVGDALRELMHDLERNQDQLRGLHYRAPEARQFVEEQEEFIYEPDADRVDIAHNNIATLELIDEQEKLKNKIRLLRKKEEEINDSDARSESSYQETMSKLNEQEAQYRTERSVINKLLQDKKEEELLDNIDVDSFNALDNSGVAAAERQDNIYAASRASTQFEQSVRDQNNMQQMHDESVQYDDSLEYQAFVNGIPSDDLRDNAPNLRQELENAENLEPLDYPDNFGVATAERQDNISATSRASTQFEQSVCGDDGDGCAIHTLNMQGIKNDVDIFSVYSMETMKTIPYNSILSNLQVGAVLELNLNSSLNFRVLRGLNKANTYGAGMDYVANKRFSTGLSFMYSYGGSIINGINAVNIKMTESIAAFFTEAKYNFPLFNTPATTYLSARFGIAKHILRSYVMHNNNTAITDTEDRAFAYGLGIGTEIAINHGVMIGLSYNINNFAFKNFNIDISQALPANSIAVKRDATCHSINLLFKVVF